MGLLDGLFVELLILIEVFEVGLLFWVFPGGAGVSSALGQTRRIAKIRQLGNVLEESLRDVKGIYIVRFRDYAVRWFRVAFRHVETGSLRGGQGCWREKDRILRETGSLCAQPKSDRDLYNAREGLQGSSEGCSGIGGRALALALALPKRHPSTVLSVTAMLSLNLCS